MSIHVGTFLTWRHVRLESVMRGEADIERRPDCSAALRVPAAAGRLRPLTGYRCRYPLSAPCNPLQRVISDQLVK